MYLTDLAQGLDLNIQIAIIYKQLGLECLIHVLLVEYLEGARRSSTSLLLCVVLRIVFGVLILRTGILVLCARLPFDVADFVGVEDLVGAGLGVMGGGNCQVVAQVLGELVDAHEPQLCLVCGIRLEVILLSLVLRL